MNKGLDLIQRRQPEFINDFPTGNISIGVTEEELTELEQELKTLEIVKKFVWVENGEIHLGLYADSEIILSENDFETQEEFELLKEVLL